MNSPDSPDFRVYTAKPEEKRGKDSKEDQSADVEIDGQIVEWLKEGHKPQNVMIVTGDKGFKVSLEKLVERGHTTIVVRRDELQEGAKIKKAKYLWGWKTFLGVSEEGPTREEQRFAKFVASEEAKQIVKERKARQKENQRIRRVAESQEKTERKAEESENKKRKAEESEIGNNKKKRKTHKKKKKAKPITGPYAKKPI